MLHFFFIVASSSCTENCTKVPTTGVKMKIVGYIHNIEITFILDSASTISVIDSKQVILTNFLIQRKGMRVYIGNDSSLNVDVE